MTSSKTISVIIPTLHVTQALQHLLWQLEGPDIIEVLVVSPFKTLDITSLKAHSLCSTQGRGPQIQKGLEHACGDIIWILHADSQLPEHAVKNVLSIMQMKNTSLGAFRIGFRSDNLWLKLFAWLSRFDSVLTTFGDQGFFFRKEHLQALPNLNTYPLMEDVAICAALSKMGKIRKASSAIITSADRFTTYGPLRTQWVNACILFKYWRGAPPIDLYEEYYSQT